MNRIDNIHLKLKEYMTERYLRDSQIDENDREIRSVLEQFYINESESRKWLDSGFIDKVDSVESLYPLNTPANKLRKQFEQYRLKTDSGIFQKEEFHHKHFFLGNPGTQL